MNAQFQMVEMLGGYDELDSIAKSIAGPGWDFDPALKTSEQLLAEGITWTYETVEVRTLLDLDPDISTEDALRAAAGSWEKGWSGSSKPTLFRAYPTTSPDRWLLAATDGTDGTEGALGAAVVQRVVHDTWPGVEVGTIFAEDVSPEHLQQFTDMLADAAQQMKQSTERKSLDMILDPGGNLWTLDDRQDLVNVTMPVGLDTQSVLTALCTLWSRTLRKDEVPESLKAFATTDPRRWLAAIVYPGEDTQVAVVHLCTDPSAHR